MAGFVIRFSCYNSDHNRYHTCPYGDCVLVKGVCTNQSDVNKAETS